LLASKCFLVISFRSSSYTREVSLWASAGTALNDVHFLKPCAMV